MGRITKQEKLQKVKVNNVDYNYLSTINLDYLQALNDDIRYSLTIDPTNKYKFNDIEKLFIENYIQHRNVPLASRLSGLTENEGLELYKKYEIKEEIERINIAIYLRNFGQKMLSLDEIGGWLSAVMTDQVPEVDKVSTKDKLAFAKMLVEIHELKKKSYDNPQLIDGEVIDATLSNLSVKSIKQLIDASNDTSTGDISKDELIDKINVDGSLSPTDIAALKSMNKEELLNLLEELNGKR